MSVGPRDHVHERLPLAGTAWHEPGLVGVAVTPEGVVAERTALSTGQPLLRRYAPGAECIIWWTRGCNELQFVGCRLTDLERRPNSDTPVRSATEIITSGIVSARNQQGHMPSRNGGTQMYAVGLGLGRWTPGEWEFGP